MFVRLFNYKNKLLLGWVDIEEFMIAQQLLSNMWNAIRIGTTSIYHNSQRNNLIVTLLGKKEKKCSHYVIILL